MPTLPLLVPPPYLAGHHRVTAPGGYETWHFDAHDRDDKIVFIAEFHLGWPLHPRYVRRYARYRAMPTRFRPPVPMDFPSLSLELYEGDAGGGGRHFRCVQDVHPSEFTASPDQLKLRAGSSHVESTADGSFRLRARGRCGGGTLEADLTFRPVFRATHAVQIDEHETLILCDPLHAVTGELHVFDAAGAGAGAAARVIRFEGIGYHEHRVALRWPGDARQVRTRGRAITGEEVTCYHCVGGAAPQCWDVNASGIAARQQPLFGPPGARTRWRLPYDLAGARVLSDTFAAARLASRAADARPHALLEVSAPHRLAWPGAGATFGPSVERG